MGKNPTDGLDVAVVIKRLVAHVAPFESQRRAL